MQANVKQAYIEEVKYQMKMLNNLKKWLRYLLSISSICLALAIWGESLAPFVQVAGAVLTVVSVVACGFVGFALKKGSDNVNKILTYMDK